MSARGGREAGFSLVEMLVALAVVAMAAVILSVGVGRLTGGLARQAPREARSDALADAARLLRLRLETLAPVPDEQTGAGAIDLVGTPDRVDFTGPPPGNTAPDALVRYRLARDAAGTVMLYAASTLDAAVDIHDPVTTGWRATPLVAGTAALAIAYYGALAGGTRRGWQDHWVHRDRLPLLVRVGVRLPAGDPRAIPDLYVRPRAAAAGPCLLAADNRTCRDTSGREAGA